MAIRTFGTNAVDWEQRVDFERLRADRLARLKARLEQSELGALLSFEMPNTRYMTATHIGTWAMDKLIRFALLPRNGEPVVWDFGSAARHHQLYNPWLDHSPGPPTPDEITLLTQACSMVDAAYDALYEFLRPGVRENECVGLVSKVLYDLGSEYVEGVNAISGERCSPHPHVYSDRLIRPGDPAFFDILHSHLGYRTCYYRTFAVGSASGAQRDAYVRCREYMDQAIALVKPGATTADIVSLWPRAEEFGFPDETAAFALQYGHGVGLSIWEKPIFSRLVSLDHPEPLEEGMVFALETYWPAADGWSAARIEEEVVVTASGCEIITKFPAEELLVAGRKYWTAGGALSTLREAQSHLNTRSTRADGTAQHGSAPGGAAPNPSVPDGSVP